MELVPPTVVAEHALPVDTVSVIHDVLILRIWVNDIESEHEIETDALPDDITIVPLHDCDTTELKDPPNTSLVAHEVDCELPVLLHDVDCEPDTVDNIEVIFVTHDVLCETLGDTLPISRDILDTLNAVEHDIDTMERVT